jgi:predicted nucleic-acid-binding Zn-ribbon protein
MKTELDVEEKIKRINREVEKLEGKLTPEDRKKIFRVLHNEEAAELCKVCRLSTIKNTLLWLLGDKELEI